MQSSGLKSHLEQVERYQAAMGVDLDAWIEKLKRCEYLAEDELKALCEYVSCPTTTSQAWPALQQHWSLGLVMTCE